LNDNYHTTAARLTLRDLERMSVSGKSAWPHESVS
jgi:hypothetical protein